MVCAVRSGQVVTRAACTQGGIALHAAPCTIRASTSDSMPAAAAAVSSARTMTPSAEIRKVLTPSRSPSQPASGTAVAMATVKALTASTDCWAVMPRSVWMTYSGALITFEDIVPIAVVASSAG